MTAKQRRGRPAKPRALDLGNIPDAWSLAPGAPESAPFFFELREDEIDPALLAARLPDELRTFRKQRPGLRGGSATVMQKFIDAAAAAMERGNAAYVAWYMAQAIRAARAATWHEELEVPGVGRRTIEQLAAIGAEKLRADRRKGRRTEPSAG